MQSATPEPEVTYTKKVMKKAMKKAMKKGKGKKPSEPKPIQLDENGNPIKKEQKMGTRKRVLTDIGDMPVDQAIKKYKQKVVEAETQVKTAERDVQAAIARADKSRQDAAGMTSQVEKVMAKNKEIREEASQARLKAIEVEKEVNILKKEEQLILTELQILQNEVEGEGRRKELREAKAMAKTAIEAAKKAKNTEKDALKEARARDHENAKKAKVEEDEAKKQAKEMALAARAKALEHKKQERAEREAEKQERLAASGKGLKTKKPRIADGEDVD